MRPMRSVLITRPRAQAGPFAAALTAAGFRVVCFPVIEIRPAEDTTALDTALASLASYDWIVFTSVNGVEVLWDRMNALSIGPMPSDLRIAAIGPQTAQALRKRGVEPHFVPDRFVAESIMPGMGDLRGRRVLLPRADIAREALPRLIEAAGGRAEEIAVYRTLPAAPDAAGLEALMGGIDIITFTSPSTVRNFVLLVRAAGLDPLRLPGAPQVACIGPITAAAAVEQGFDVGLIADEFTTDGLTKALVGERQV